MAHETPCKYEERFSNLERAVTGIEEHIDYKDKRIDELIKDQKSMEKKIDKISETVNAIMLKSVQDDNNIDKRVTSLETTVRVLKWIVGLLFGSGIIWLILNFAK